jgi:ABC-2 type transport system permease protein
MGMWTLCLQAGGNIIENERGDGTFEALVSTPARLRMVIVGRVTAIVGVMVLTLPQIWLLTWIVFGERITVAHPAVFAAAMAGMLVGLHATALLFAAVFVLAREALILQNAVAYPIYLLGGLVVPVSVLPDWLQPLTRLIFLSWGSDLLRASLRPETPAHLAASLAGLAVTSCAMIALGQFFLGRVIDRARRLGTLSLT